jgi:methylthioribose-1-phosphate isomerase
MTDNLQKPIWFGENGIVCAIDQRMLPHEFRIFELKTVDDIIFALKTMVVRGAPLIGLTGAWGVYVAVSSSNACSYSSSEERKQHVINECIRIKNARPTAINLSWAVDMCLGEVLKEIEKGSGSEALTARAREMALWVDEYESENCRKIGVNGLDIINKISESKKGSTVNILTHCNAGWLACIAHGTATAPIYAAHDAGIDVHVWVDETRPLNQGSRLTAWELGRYGVKHTVIADNTGGHLMQHGMVDLVIVGTDRTTRSGDVANKIGTYLKALAAHDNGIPFYVALPSSTFDWTITDGVRDIPIEERNPDEIRYVQGLNEGRIMSVLVPPEGSPAVDYAFDVTPARLVTGFITENGVCGASEDEILSLFPDRKK